MNRILANILCLFIPFKELRHNIRRGNKGINNKIILIKDGKEYKKPFYKIIKGLHMNIEGNNNTIKIELPFSSKSKSILKINIHKDNNFIKIGKNYNGHLTLSQYGDNNYFEIGNNFSNSGMCNILSVNNTIKIGNDCMVADNIEILCDGHAVIDAKTKKCLNIPSTPVLIGNHVWLGRKCLLLKGAQIPDDCIVATRSIVTKKFEESNCIIAGQPAKIVKNGISWNSLSPVDYEKSLNS